LFSLNSGYPGVGTGSSGDGVPAFATTAAGGNGACNCIHVEQLLVRVRALEQSRIPVSGAQREPFLPSMRASLESPPGMAQAPEAIDINGQMKLTLPLGHLGNEKRDRSFYDDKLMTQAEYRFDGGKDGATWKSNVERYFITTVPVAMEVLKWAEAHNLEPISEAKFVSAACPHINEEQCGALSREIWGFLSGCLSGQAETHFKRAGMLNGLDAWRRVVRIIEDTLPMRFEQLRRAAQMVHLKMIRDLDGIPNGVAEFETTLEEYEAVGGDKVSDQVRKSDLLAILPGKLQTDLLWNSTNPEWSYVKFRDHVLTQSSKILDLEKNFTRINGGVHAVAQRDDAQPPPLGSSTQEDEEEV
jgi:hypothetical protein